jgi:hypothetical protein
MLTIGGIRGDYPPAYPAGFDAFMATLLTADIAAAIVGAEPLDDPVPFRFPASVRHRYERLPGFPAGLLVIGDAACSFNPIYGQGMTVAAAEAMILRDLLARQAVPDARRYFRAITAAINPPWDIAAGADLAFPQVPGHRPAKVRLVNAYMPRLPPRRTAPPRPRAAGAASHPGQPQAARAAPRRPGTTGCSPDRASRKKRAMKARAPRAVPHGFHVFEAEPGRSDDGLYGTAACQVDALRHTGGGARRPPGRALPDLRNQLQGRRRPRRHTADSRGACRRHRRGSGGAPCLPPPRPTQPSGSGPLTNAWLSRLRKGVANELSA